MKARLTERQNQAYEYIRSYMRQNGKPPTIQEIGRELAIQSTNGVFKLLKTLEAKGYIRREKHTARGLHLMDADEDPFAFDEGVPSLPLVSRTSSHQPEMLRKRLRGALFVDPHLLRGSDPDACLIGRAGDDGMNGEGIRKGDFLVIEEVPREAVRDGEMAAFLVREDLIVRRFNFVNGRIHLRPADRSYTDEAFYPDDPQCYLVGRIVGLMRKL